ncbi:MAG: exodeoxyribonuclease V subunit gamma, partial [Actinomycetes bacterium]
MLAVHRAGRGDGLAGGLAELLRDPLGDPFTPEVVAVPTRGVERWLTQTLATVLGASAGRQDGVCANIDFPFPATLVATALAAATGIDPDTDPWKPERAVWPLLEVVDACVGEPWLATLAAHLGAGRSDSGGPGGGGPGGGDPGIGADVRRYRRFATVRHLADLYDRYAVHRPDVLAAWAAGEAGAGVPDDLAWQGELWRGLRARIGLPSLAERLPDACRRLRQAPDLVDLPGRLSLFGLTRLPASYLDVLVALSEHRAVHLWLLHPSPALWDRASAQARHPILATWGRDAREMQLVLAAAGVVGGTEIPVRAPPDGGQPGTLLGRIQADIRADRAPPIPAISPTATDSRPELDPSDRSLQVHACHGPARQVEVLRDAIFHLLADDPTLEPRHIIVMCPDIDAFAPLIGATFGTTEKLGLGGDLHVRLADRSIRQTNPVLGAVSALLDLAGSRVKASEVLDLVGREPVRRRFRFD